MRKFELALIILFIIAVLIFIQMVYGPGLPGLIMSSSNTIDEYGISSIQKDNAVKAALAEPSIITENYEADSVSVVRPGDAGFIYVTGYLIKVSLYYMLAGRERVQFDVYVDPVTNRTMAVSHYGIPPGPYDWAMIPPGASWYHKTIAMNVPQSDNSSSLGIVVPELHPAIVAEPQNEKVYLTIVDEDNFSRLKNGLSYEGTAFVDPSSGASMSIKDQPVNGSWNATLTLPAIKEEYEPGTLIIKTVPLRTYYLVITNEKDNEPVKTTYGMPGYM